MKRPLFPIRATEVVGHPLLTSQQAQEVRGKAGPAHICFWGGNLFISASVPILVWMGLLPPLSVQEGPTYWGPLSYCMVKFGFDVSSKALNGFLPPHGSSPGLGHCSTLTSYSGAHLDQGPRSQIIRLCSCHCLAELPIERAPGLKESLDMPLPPDLCL